MKQILEIYELQQIPFRRYFLGLALIHSLGLFLNASACLPIGKDIERPDPLLFLVGLSQSDTIGVISSDFSGTGRFSTLSQDGLPGFGYTAIHSDARARYQDGRVYVINRLNRDNIQILNPAFFYQTEFEFALEDRSNPHDFLKLNEEKSYITLYGKSDLMIFHPRTGLELGRIDLGPYADTNDGIPEMSQMHLEGSRLYVTIARLNRTDTTDIFPPTDYSSLLEIDTLTDSIVAEHRFSRTNPSGKLRRVEIFGEPHLISALPSHSGFNQKLDGGVEAFNLNSKRFRPELLYEESTAGGDILDVIIKNDSTAYALVLSADFGQTLQKFNPSTGQKIKELAYYPASAGFVSGMLLLPDGRLFTADAGVENPGVMIYDTEADDRELTATPIDVGLPPQDLVYIPVE